MMNFFYLLSLGLGCTRLPIEDGWNYGTVTQVKDVFTSSFVVESENGIFLIDSGYDEKAKPIISVLENKNKSASDVIGIFYTHGHQDHMAGTDVFQNAQTYALSAERNLIEEEGGRIDVEIEDGEILDIGSVTVEVISVTGHTTGNAVYLVNDILIMGDSAQARKDGDIELPADKYSDDPQLASESLESLGTYLQPRKEEIAWTAFSHSGPLKGIDALLRYQSE